jgi:signal recognition particle subunit SRP54
MDEIRHIAGAVDPHYTFLVIDAMTGQDAVSTASAFHEALALDGVILTKLDGDARGGAALSVKEVVGRPIAFASTGEKLDDFDLFHPDRMADRILGMGDVLSLIEQAERTMDKDVATKGAAAIVEGRFTLEDFLEQLQQVKKMGSVSGMLSLLPGVPKDLKQMSDAVGDDQIRQVEAIIRSMTPAERQEPSLIDGSRRVRIANGSGTTTAEVNSLLKQFRDMQKLMKGMGKGKGRGGALGGLGALLGGGGGARMSPAAMAEMAEQMGGLESLGGAGGAGALPAAGEPASRGGGNGRAAGSARAKGKGGKKRKGGGRVTPKSR